MSELKERRAAKPVHQQISEQKVKSLLRARIALKTVITTIEFLGKQVLAVRGHNKDGGNFLTLLARGHTMYMS